MSDKSIPESLYKYFEAHPDIHKDHDGWHGTCPVHKGDNPKAFKYYSNNNVWQCFTRGCHSEGASGLSLIKRLNLQCGKFTFKSSKYSPPKREQKYICSVEKYRQDMQEIPSKYALSRNFSQYILNKYSIGTCYTSKWGHLDNRCCCPILSDDAKSVVGVTGRDITGQSDCKWYHYKFKTSSNLYNFPFAKSSILNTKTVIITEGVFDCLRLVQNGITNVVSVFGIQLSAVQQSLIEGLNVKNIILALDGDEAGKTASEVIIRKYKHKYNIKIAMPKKSHDWDEATSEDIRKEFKGCA